GGARFDGLGLDQAEIRARGEDVGRRAPAMEQGSADAEHGFGGGKVVSHGAGFGCEVEALQGGHGATVGPGDGASGVEIEDGDGARGALGGALESGGGGFLDGSLPEAGGVVGEVMGVEAEGAKAATDAGEGHGL